MKYNRFRQRDPLIKKKELGIWKQRGNRERQENSHKKTQVRLYKLVHTKKKKEMHQYLQKTPDTAVQPISGK